jgi:predicted nucleic acid-binding protein
VTALVFVDTNVLLYAVDYGHPSKQALAAAWREGLWLSKRGRLSFQVLQEFYAVAQKRSMAAEEARDEVRDLLSWNPIPINGTVIEACWKIQGLSIVLLGLIDRCSRKGNRRPISADGGLASKSGS